MHLFDNERVPIREKSKGPMNPYRILALSFLFVMGIGTILLMLPMAAADGRSTSLVDAAFTAVSCVSVTGLAVLDTHTHWSMIGKWIMVGLIQLGGLGILTFTTLLALVFGRHLGLKNRLLIQEDVGSVNMSGLIQIVRKIAFLTFGVEFIGGIIYVIQLYPYIGEEAYYVGFMQAVSIFCNAGFVFFDNNLPYQMVTDWIFTINSCSLIIIGGFGYISIFDLWNNRKDFRFINLLLNTKLMLVGTVGLISVGTIAILLLEWSNPDTLGPLSYIDKFQAALFQSITPRTAGMATLDYGQMHPITLFLTIILMFIGAGPNSTGGGIKITTAILVLAASATVFTNENKVELYERQIPTGIVFKAFGIVIFSILMILFVTFVVTLDETDNFLKLLFEVTSAFGTVGLSTGITPTLTTVSKWMLIFMMFTGRIGVITLLGTWGLRRKGTNRISYPEGQVML